MARKERKKKVKLTGIGYELVGILLVLLSILMIGQLGIIGTFLKKLGLFLVGEFFWVLTIAMIIYGWRFIVKRQSPGPFNSKQIGWGLVFVSLIVFSHLPVYREFKAHNIPILEGMLKYYFSNDILNNSFTAGGGLAGAIIYGLLVPLVTTNGLYIVSLFVLCYGTLLIFDLTVKDFYEKARDYQMKQRQSVRHKKRVPTTSRERVRKTDATTHEPVVTLLNESVDEEELLEVEETDEEEHIEEEEFKIKEFDKHQPLVEQEPILETEIQVLKDENYVLPPLDLLFDYQQTNHSQRLLVSAKSQARKLEDTFKILT